MLAVWEPVHCTECGTTQYSNAAHSRRLTFKRDRGCHSITAFTIMDNLQVRPPIVPSIQLMTHVIIPQVVPTSNDLDIPWFAAPVYTEEEVEMYSLGSDTTKPRPRVTPELPALPEDPRDWSRAEVCAWVAWLCAAHSLPAPDIERFLMNGKAVCLMTVGMFSTRVPLGGKLLYRDFQIRLAKALYK